MILRGLRVLSALTVGIAAGLLVISLPWPRQEFVLGGRTYQTLHLAEAFTSLIAAGLIRLLLEKRSLRILGSVPRRAGIGIYLLVGLNLLLLPQTLGQALAYLVEDIPLLLAARGDPWDSVNPAPREVIEVCLQEVAPHERILLAGGGIRDFQGYLLTYYIHPRAVLMVPSDENAMYFAYRDPFADPDAAMFPVAEEEVPTREEYRRFIDERDVDWVLEVREIVPARPGMENWHLLLKRGRRGQVMGFRPFQLIRSEEAFR